MSDGVSATFSLDDIDCWWVVKASAMATLDALCCIPCCFFCGGCCGRYTPFLARMSDDRFKPGIQTCNATCMSQVIAAVVVPGSCCVCCWGCCGTAVPCARSVARCVLNVENGASNKKNRHSTTMPPREQVIMIHPDVAT